ncbi:MAG: hypothetical protein ABSF71_09450 [Terriglobia bacterium]|jgi:hypothetical protein
MEVLLNTIWLLVAIGAFLYWRPEKYKGTPRAHGHDTTFGILALACALVLLFPVISLTDDLNAEQFTMEDSFRTGVKARGLAQESLRATRSPFMVAVTTAPDSTDPPHVFLGSVALVESRVLCLTLISPHEGRAPPSLV